MYIVFVIVFNFMEIKIETYGEYIEFWEISFHSGVFFDDRELPFEKKDFNTLLAIFEKFGLFLVGESIMHQFPDSLNAKYMKIIKENQDLDMNRIDFGCIGVVPAFFSDSFKKRLDIKKEDEAEDLEDLD